MIWAVVRIKLSSANIAQNHLYLEVWDPPPPLGVLRSQNLTFGPVEPQIPYQKLLLNRSVKPFFKLLLPRTEVLELFVSFQIQFEGDPASALVTFSNPSEAETAFSSAEAVLGNR